MKIWDDESDLVTFYTVEKEDAHTNETDHFFEKYSHNNAYKEATQQLIDLLLNQMGNKFGAVEAFFNRSEDGAFGLPPHGRVRLGKILLHYPEFPLRLYALRINNREDIVVLFNGGIKSSASNVGSPDIRLKANEARHYSERIDKALRDGTIIVDEHRRQLLSAEGDTEIILY